MAAQVSILARKVLVDASTVEWYSAPMYWGGYKEAEMFLEVHGLGQSCTVDMVFEGATEPGENANWQTMTDTGTVLSATGVSKFSTTDIYPYVRIKVVVDAGTLNIAEVSLAGQLFDE